MREDAGQVEGDAGDEDQDGDDAGAVDAAGFQRHGDTSRGGNDFASSPVSLSLSQCEWVCFDARSTDLKHTSGVKQLPAATSCFVCDPPGFFESDAVTQNSAFVNFAVQIDVMLLACMHIFILFKNFIIFHLFSFTSLIYFSS